MRVLSLLLVLCWVAVVHAEPPTEEDYYRIVPLRIPEGVVLEPGGLTFLPSGELAASTRRGDIYVIGDPLGAPEQMSWRQFASGMHEVLGLTERDGWLYATQRGEVTRLQDTDGDGQADVFETVCAGWGLSGDYHEYAFGSPFDRDGYLWVALCLTGSFSSEVPYRGWCVRVAPDGTMLPTCSGIRSPGGIGMNAEGDMFYTDNQGPWNGTCTLRHLKPGSFQGHPGGNRWYELTDAIGPRPADPMSDSRMIVEAAKIPELLPPAVYFPYKKMGQSASGIACDMTGGRFGPFAGQLFVADQTNSTVMRVWLERVNGRYQGVCFPFKERFGSGSLSLVFHPNGHLFVGGTSRGWGSRGPHSFALERVDWTGATPFEVLTMSARRDGFELEFTQPVDRTSAARTDSYELETYTYIYRAAYGSPEVDRTRPTIREVDVSEDGRRVRLHIEGLQRGHVHELHLDGVRSADGLPLLHSEAYYTLNEIPADEHP